LTAQFLLSNQNDKVKLLRSVLAALAVASPAQAAGDDGRRWSMWCRHPGVPVMNVWQDRRGMAWLRIGRGPSHVGDYSEDDGRYLRFVASGTALHFRTQRDLSGVTLMVETEPGGYSPSLDLLCEVTVKPPEFRRPEPAQPAPRRWPDPRAVQRT
jgi:hypothetical protein